jgi:Na+-transporting NADH:ubiquinone oxidoreductase subunit C
VKDNAIRAYILPVHSRGLWGKIEGYIALENDGKTVAGFTVYSQQETPGLGGEIEKAWFQNNFRGKRIVGPDGKFQSVAIAKGRVADRIPPKNQANYVDGISGATLTGRFLSQGLRDTLLAYEKVSINFRKGRINLETVSTAKTGSS